MAAMMRDSNRALLWELVASLDGDKECCSDQSETRSWVRVAVPLGAVTLLMMLTACSTEAGQCQSASGTFDIAVGGKTERPSTPERAVEQWAADVDGAPNGKWEARGERRDDDGRLYRNLAQGIWHVEVLEDPPNGWAVYALDCGE